jgi:membrane associated rhomboid family serine protease
MIRLTEVCKHLLIINVALFLLSQVIDLSILRLYCPSSEHFQPFQVVTYGFMHSGLSHIFFNMLGLVMIGGSLEELLGPKRFLALYLSCLIFSGIAYEAVHLYEFNKIESALNALSAAPSYDLWNQLIATLPKGINPEFVNQFSKMFIDNNFVALPQLKLGINELLGQLNQSTLVGASGAIFGLIIGIGALMPEADFYIFPIPVAVKAKYLIPISIVAEYFLLTTNNPNDSTAHLAHIAGSVLGGVIMVMWFKTSK